MLRFSPAAANALLFSLALASCNRPPIEPGGSGQTTDPGSTGGGGGNDDGSQSGDGDGTTDETIGGEEVVDPEEPPPEVVKESCGDFNGTDPWAPGYRVDPEVEQRVGSLVGSMSLEEKISQMHGMPVELWQGDIFSTPDNEDKGISGFHFRDGPRGVRLFEPEKKSMYATSFPVAVARAATFDRELERAIGEAIGKETLASGHNVILAPTINTLRHPGWGRGQETYGEDSFVLGKMGSAFVIGAQEFVPACVKHLAANNIEDTRMTNNAVMDAQTLQEVYLRHFEMTVKEAGAACIMSAYNRVNGPYSSESSELLGDILRGQWGFRGFVVSDWGAAHNATLAANAGLDVEMPNWPVYGKLKQAVEGNQVPLAKINEAVTHILEQKFRFNIAGLNQTQGLGEAARSDIGSKAHTDLAYETAQAAITLLKNDGILPLSRDTAKKVAVVGTWAAQPRLGDQGSSDVFPDPARVVPPYQGIKARAGAGVSVVTSTDKSAISGADVVFVVAALTPADEGEAWNNGGDRDTLEVSADQVALIKAVAADHDHVVVVLVGGGPITMESWRSDVEGIVMAWYPGEQGGLALGDLVWGDANFSGHTPMTWPKKLADEPPFNNKQEETVMPFLHGYRHFDDTGTEPLFPFGFGLSYTTFEYKNLQVPCSDITPGGVIEVKVDITNTGEVAGDTVAFMFVSYPDSKVRRAKKDLKGFTRVSLEAGQTKRVSIPLRIADLAYFDADRNAYQVEATTYEVLVGTHAGDLPLHDTFVVKP